MKNRVSRSAIVAILVVAMMLTIVACQKAPAAYVEAPQPQAPIAAPVEEVEAPVEAPKLEDKTITTTVAQAAEADDSAALKADYGITFTAKDKTYGVDKDDTISSSSTEKVGESIKISFANGFDTSRNDLSITVDSLDYESRGTVEEKPKKDDYDVHETTDRKTNKKYRYIDVAHDDPAGTYTFEITVSIKDKGVDFAYWGIPKAEDAKEYVIVRTVTIAPKEIWLSYTTPYVAASAPAEDPKDNIVPSNAVEDLKPDEKVWYSGNKDQKDESKALLRAALAAKGASLYVLTPSYDKTLAQAVKMSLVVAKSGAIEGTAETGLFVDEDKFMDFAEITEKINNFTFKFNSGSLNVLSKFEYNEVGDVITSILDIRKPASGGDAAVAKDVQYELALMRYNNLNKTQQGFMKSISNVTNSNPDFSSTINMTIYFTADKAYNTTAVESATSGSNMVKWLTETIAKAQKAQKVIDDWTKFVKSVEWDKYGEDAANKFNPKDEFAMNSYNKVAEYVKADSSLKDKLASDPHYLNYKAATEMISVEKIEGVAEYLKGAFAAYDKAILHDTTIDYGTYNNTVYIDSEEIKLLTKGAYEAFSALTSDEQNALNTDHSDVLSSNVSGSTPAADIKALNKMVNAVDSIKEIVNYVKIENYAKTNPSLYATLRLLVYGEGVEANGDKDFFGNEKKGTYGVGEKTPRWAISDVVKLIDSPRARASAVAEYKAWIDAVIAFEDVKAAALDAFNLAFNEYCVDKELPESAIVSASIDYAKIVVDVMNGTRTNTANGIKYLSVSEIIALRAPETIDEVREYFEDAFDGEKLAKNLTYTDGDGWTLAPIV